MKSISQMLEQKISKTARAKVRNAVQSGTITNVIDCEINTLLTDILNERLRKEQEELLQRSPYQRSQEKHYRNGFKLIKLKGIFASFFVRKPVLRSKTPPSPILKTLKHFGSGIIAALASRFWLRGTSTRATAQELNNTFGTKVSAFDVSRFSNSILPDVQAWLDRPLPNNIAYLFLDALYIPVRKPGFTTKQAILVAIGISTTGSRHVLSFILGDRETLDSWSAILNDLLKRGLNRNALKLVISDDHKAIAAAVENTLAIPHQRCVIHKMRNALARVSAQNRKEFYADFSAAYWADSKELCLIALGKLQQKWQSVYPKATAIAIDKPDAFTKFFDHPCNRWSFLRSTNFIERFNREIRRRLNPAGAIQSEHELFKLLWSVSSNQEVRWNKRKSNVFNDLAVAA
jgi:transposase-like protein